MVKYIQSLASVVFFALSCSPIAHAEWHYEEHQIFGTRVSIQLWSENEIKARNALDQSVAEMWRIHNKFSPYLEESELSQLNSLGHSEPIQISPELTKLLDKSLFYGELSKGAFDITYASIGYLYDYRESKKPSQKQIENLQSAINFRLIKLQQETNQVSFLNENVKIDLGGIAKGYAIDQVAELLKNLGISHAAITAGGDSRVVGDKRGQPWLVGIRNPRADETAIRIPLEDFAISTSGDYERYFIDEKSGERIHHILNPANGKSANSVSSVSVIGPSGFDTDPLSTTLFVLGKEKGILLIEKLPGFDAIFIDLQGQVHFSSGLQPPE